MGLVVGDMKKKAMPAAEARTGSPRLKKAIPNKGAGKAPGRGGSASREKKGRAKVRGQRSGVRGQKPAKTVKEAGRSARAPVKAVKVITAAVVGPEVALADGQQERFCRLMADGRYSGRSCYAQAFGCENEGSARTLAWRLLTKVDITDRIDWLKRESLKTWACDKEEVMRMLHQVITTPVGYVDEESPLAQEVTRDLIEKGEDAPAVLKVKVKMPGKVEAAKLLAQMQGWEKPKELLLTMDYEPPGKALERAKAKNLDLAAILAKAGLLGGGRKSA